MDCILVWTPVWTAYCWTTYSMDCILLSSRQRDLKKKTFLFISVKIASCYGLQFSNVKYLLSLLPSGSPCTCGCIVRLQYCDFFFYSNKYSALEQPFSLRISPLNRQQILAIIAGIEAHAEITVLPLMCSQNFKHKNQKVRKQHGRHR